MTKPKKAVRAKAAAKLKDLKARKNPAGGVFNSSIKTDLARTGGVPGTSAQCCLQTAV
jgi:hypothetical protein